MLTKSDQQPSRDFAAYGMIIIQLARKHGGKGWILYDRQFWQHCAAGANLPWANLNPSLMAATVIGHSGDHIPPRRSCPLCLSADHTREECALASIEAAKHPLIHPPGCPNNFQPVQSVDLPHTYQHLTTFAGVSIGAHDLALHASMSMCALVATRWVILNIYVRKKKASHIAVKGNKQSHLLSLDPTRFLARPCNKYRLGGTLLSNKHG